MKLRGYLQNILYLFLFGLMSQASATPYYSHDFQWDIGASVPGWSAGTIQSAPNPDYGGWRRFLGEFSNAGTSLSLAGLPTHDAITLSFDLYLLRSWDGEAIEYGPVRFGVSADSALLFLESFSNGHPAGQSYCPGDIAPCSPMTGAAERYSLGYKFGYWDVDANKIAEEVMDAVYQLTFNFSHSADSLTLTFFAQGLQGLTPLNYLDESWGLDNVKITLHTIPEPSVFTLVAITIAFLLASRFRHFSWLR